MIYIVATPIGNLGDISTRARMVLESVDFIVAEDTRHSGELLASCHIKKPLLSFRDAPTPVMNRALGAILARLARGQSGAYITDAGTPGLSDPGWRLVSAALDAGFALSPIPGPSAVTTLLSIADFATHEYRFMAFLPKKKGFQTTISRLIDYLAEGKNRSVIFYESPHRVKNTLSAFMNYHRGPSEPLLSLKALVGRELTKKFETVYRGELTEDFIAMLPAKGEYVVLLHR